MTEPRYTWQDAVKAAATAIARKESWYWYFACLPLAERLAMDSHIVGINHPMAFEPGTQESRFHKLAREAIA